MSYRPRSLPPWWVMLSCVAVLAAWASSYGFPGRRGWTDSSGATWFVGSDNGCLRVSRQSAWATRGDGRTVLSFDTSRFGTISLSTQFGPAGLSNIDMNPRYMARHGFTGVTWVDARSDFRMGVDAGSPVATTRLATLSLSYPALLLAAVAVPLLLTGRARRRWNRAVREGRCPACGYDVRATPERCPECGVEPTEARPAGLAARSANAFVTGSLAFAVGSVLLSYAGSYVARLLPPEAVPAVTPACHLVALLAALAVAGSALKSRVQG